MTESNGGDARARLRAALAVEAYRLNERDGLSTREIAELFTKRGPASAMSYTKVHRLIKEARDELPWLEILDRDNLRAAQAGRLEDLYSWVKKELVAGRVDMLKAATVLLKIEDRVAKLGGSDAPTRIDVSGKAVETPRDMYVLEALRAAAADDAALDEEDEASG